MAAEVIELDPSEVAISRTELDISAFVDADGIDWGDAEISAYMAEGERGSAPVDYRIPNRTVTIPLMLKTVGATTFSTIRASIQAKAALMQREGGWLKRTLTNGTSTYYLDIVNATLKLSGGWLQAHRDADIDAVLTLEAIPDFYGAEVTLPDHTETTLPHLVFTDTGITGDYPARVRLVVDEDDGDDQMFLMYGVQSRYYSADASAALFWEAEWMAPLGGAAVAVGITGSSGSGSNVVRQGTLTTTYQAMLSTQSAGGVHLSHIGTYRVWARTHRPATNAGEVSVALEWGEGDFRLRTVNDPVVYEADDREGAYCLTDLGLVSPSRVAQGTQRWEGRVIAKSTVTGDDLDVDCLWLMPVDEGYGEIRGVTQFETPTAFTGRDGFDQSAGNLAGKTAAVGGVWALLGTDGDWAVETAGRTAEKTGTAQAASSPFETLNLDLAATAVQVDFKRSVVTAGLRQGVGARVFDANNWFAAELSSDGTNTTLEIRKRVTGTVTTIRTVLALAPALAAATLYSVRLQVDAGGRYFVWFGTPGSILRLVDSGHDSVLATGGALATGDPGMSDYNGGVTASTRNYDNFLAFAPTGDAAIFASQSCEIRQDRVIREDSAGAVWAPTAPPLGDYIRLPPSGLENRPARIILKASRNDPDTMTDPGIDDISARAYYRSSWLSIPG